MKVVAPCGTALLAIAGMLACGAVCSQARGPSASEVKEHGQDVGSSASPTPRSQLAWGWKQVPNGVELPTPEVAALGLPGELDDATRLARIAEMQAWLRRLPGRYRIDGHVETPGQVTVQAVGAGGAMNDQSMGTLLEGKVSGVVDCASVGDGVGLNCIINASWPVIDVDVAAMNSQPTLSEMLNTLRPAMLNIGLNRDPPGIRAQLVTDDSIAHVWAGKLVENAVRADRLTGCKDAALGDTPDQRCLQPLEIIAEPGSEVVTIILRSRPLFSPPWEDIPEFPKSRLTITLTMHRDPAARAEKPMQRKKVR
jgi:hypothetical protein